MAITAAEKRKMIERKKIERKLIDAKIDRYES